LSISNKHAFENTVFPELGRRYSLNIFLAQHEVAFFVLEIPWSISGLSSVHGMMNIFAPHIVFVAALLASILYAAIKECLYIQSPNKRVRSS
jgi:hypothetical protein